jgi:glycosyltransferase involved in cell wall biosynthesis
MSETAKIGRKSWNFLSSNSQVRAVVRVAFPSYDVRTIAGVGGGVGTFIAHFAKRLRDQGDEVSIIFATGATHPIKVDQRWREIYQSWGIELLEVHNDPFDPNRWPDFWTMRLSEKLTPILRNFDVAYFGDWGNLAFDTVRKKRLGLDKLPTCVTVLHGASTWCRWGDRSKLVVPDHLNLEFLERYAARHSDFVAAPSRNIVDYVEGEGWTFRQPPAVLGLPFFPASRSESIAQVKEFRRIVYFGRLQMRKGYNTMVDALLNLHRTSPKCLRSIDEIAFVGHDQENVFAALRDRLACTGLTVTHAGNLDSDQAGDYLRKHAVDSLVVVPSPHENFPYAVIECSLIAGLNVICTNGGGTPEIFRGQGSAQLFDPNPEALAAKMRERLERPLKAHELVAYDFETGNREWLAFHEKVRAASEKKPRRRTARKRKPTVDVCITYFNKARYLPQLLKSLEHQTTQDFGVIAVDDGSTDPEAVATFDAMAETYAGRGWTFFRQQNLFVDAARNAAAARSSADYLLMVDADDVLFPNAVERMVDVAIVTGDDCLGASTLSFSGDEFPFDLETGEIRVPVIHREIPLGSSLVAGMIDPAVFGGPMILIKRDVFEAVGGYRELRGAAHEDWELHVRLALGGYKTDVIPEYLRFYRQLDDSLSRRSDRFIAKRRLIEAFDRSFGEVGLYGTANAIWALYSETQELKVLAKDAMIERRKLEQQLEEMKQRLKEVEDRPAVPEKRAVRFGSPL